MHTAKERASTADLAPDTKRRDAISRPPTSKAASAIHRSRNGAGNKPPARLGSSGPIKAVLSPRTKALYMFQGMKDMWAQME